jgi:hypothetical protein
MPSTVNQNAPTRHSSPFVQIKPVNPSGTQSELRGIHTCPASLFIISVPQTANQI